MPACPPAHPPDRASPSLLSVIVFLWSLTLPLRSTFFDIELRPCHPRPFTFLFLARFSLLVAATCLHALRPPPHPLKGLRPLLLQVLPEILLHLP
ncbi:hypothetical protein F5888DRAFT_1737539 [Russula emetica]|nr:hypothetical protein F5888DRAFT_1737539 [Russula emetica]